MRLRRLLAALLVLLLSAALPAQESYEARARRLQPEDIPPLIEKAQQGDKQALILLWLAYSGGHGVPRDETKGVPWLLKLAETDSPEAWYILSNLYADGGAGLPQDHKKAFQWALKAAEEGHYVAQNNLAAYYMAGQGVARDPQQAVRWYTASAEAGWAQAQMMLGRIYREGKVVPQNRAEAIKWLEKAIAQGHTGAMVELAFMYTGPTGVPLQPQLVFDLHQAAAARGNVFSEYALGRIYRAGYMGPADYASAAAWLRKASHRGYAPADLALGEMAEQGQGSAASLAAAFADYQRAADLGYTPAMDKLAAMYRTGSGVSVDPVNAAMWLTIAGKMGAADSQHALQALSGGLSESQRQMATARASVWITEHPEEFKQTAGSFDYLNYEWVYDPSPVRKEPSTASERAYALQLTHRLEQDPLSLDATAARAWLDQWWQEIPDLTVRPCNFIDPPDHAKYDYSTVLYKQITYSEGAFILEHPASETNWNDAFLAGVKGALKAYQVIVQEKSAHSLWLDDMQRKSDSGELGGFVAQLAQQRCK